MNTAPVRRVLDADARVEACCSDAVAVVGERRAGNGPSVQTVLVLARHDIIRLQRRSDRRP